MSNVITEIHEIKVYNESTRLFLVRSFSCYELYIKNMQRHMENSFLKNIEDRRYMDDIFDKIIENSKDGFSRYLKECGSSGSLKDVLFDEVKVNLRHMHNVIFSSDLLS